MKQKTSPFTLFFTVIAAVILLITACSTPEKKEPEKADPVAANIKMYSQVWDEIMNKGKLDLFNDSNFTKDVVMHALPASPISSSP